KDIVVCLKGPLTKSLLEEIGNALRNYMQHEHVTPSAAMDVFAAYIKMTQNIRHYAASKGWGESEAAATIVIARDAAGHYVISAGNIVEAADGQDLLSRVNALAVVDKAQLKAAYKAQLRKPRDAGAASSAGLGLIAIARRASEPLACSLRTLDDGRAFLSLRVVV